MGKIEMKRFDVVSVAKMAGIVSAVFGFISGIFASVGSIFALATSSAFSSMYPTAGMGMEFAPLFGVFAIIIMPIIAGIAGFVAGAIMAFVYNIVAERFGGMVFETK